MTLAQQALMDVAAFLVAFTLLGLAVRRRIGLWRSFAVYLVVVLVCNRLILLWPERYFTTPFWNLKTALYTSARCLMALELALLMFAVLPRVRARALGLMTLILAVTWALSLTRIPGHPDVEAVGGLGPLMQLAGLWMLAVVPALAARYRLPMHPFHRTVLVGFGLYLVVYSGLLAGIGLVAHSRPAYLAAYDRLNAIDPLVYVTSLLLWAWAAWRRPIPQTVPAGVMRVLQPWASTR